MNLKNKYLISIVGPTAIGKTSLSIKLAQHFNTEIISVDSRQFYKEMQIGTAAPTVKELQQAKHHFIHNKSIKENYNVGAFEKDAIAVLDKLFKDYETVIMVGGSGLYVDAVLKGLDYFPEIDPKIRKNLTELFKKEGIEVLQNKLQELDVETYNAIELENPKRLIRALEVCIGSGTPYSTFKNKPKAPRNFHSIKIGLEADREIIYNRINKRVDLMMENGLLEEAEKLHQYKNLNALQTVGYRELFSYFESNFSKEFAVSEIKKNTRRFAKRQGTWFKRDKDILWFNYLENINTIITKVSDKINVLNQ